MIFRFHGSVLLAVLAAGSGCHRPGTDSADTADPCLLTGGSGSGARIVKLVTDTFAEGVTLGLVLPEGEPLLAEGAPVVVAVHGGWEPDVLPLEQVLVSRDLGVVQVYVNLPGGTGDVATPGEDDHRGSQARAALAEALRYAAGTSTDTDGCLLADRSPTAIASLPPVLFGQSNGGNLALATLADEALDLPEVLGLATFETPFSAQFVGVELGSTAQALPRYPEGDCTWEPDPGLVCPYPYGGDLGWSDEPRKDDGVEGAAFLDLDGDHAWTDGEDFPLWGQRLDQEGEERIAYSPYLRECLEQAGVEQAAFLSQDEVETWWAERDGSRNLQAALERFPHLVFLSAGSEEDHMSSAPDHAHVTGLAFAAREAGSSWVRVNPARTWLDALAVPVGDFAGNDPNAVDHPGDPAMELLPPASEAGWSRAQVAAAAVAELCSRAAGEGDTDIDTDTNTDTDTDTGAGAAR